MSTPALAVVAAWEPDVVRRSTNLLGSFAEGLPGWRSRIEAVGRELEAASAWCGPAAGAAARAVVDLSGVVAAVTRSCEESLGALQRLAGKAGRAQGLAEEARALAADAGTELGSDGRPVPPVPGPTPAMAADQAAAVAACAATLQRASAAAEEALRLATGVVTDAGAADDALSGLGVVGATTTATFEDLASLAALGNPALSALPLSRRPDAIAAWWAGMSAGDRQTWITLDPQLVGALDGVPGWARDRANRLLLARTLVDPTAPGYDDALTVAAVLAGTRNARLFLFSPQTGRVAVAIGDVDTAQAVGVLVPGMRTTVDDDLGSFVRAAGRVAHAAQAAAPGVAVATVAWLGYRTPGWLGCVSTADARVGGRQLDDTLDGLAAARAAAGSSAPRTSVLAHSYGTVVLDEAAHRPGQLQADAVALLGSPGMGYDGAAGLETPEVYEATGGVDVIADTGWFGQEPWGYGYGAEPLPTGFTEWHTHYYDPAYPTLAALGRVVVGLPETG